MKYMGSKNRIAKEILPIMLKYRTEGMTWVEPFVGGANMIDKIEGKRIANDINSELIAMFDALVYGDWKPNLVSIEKYNEIRANKDQYKTHIIGWVGFNCSYCGKYFGGFAGETATKDGLRNYQTEAINNTLKQVPKLKGVIFENKNYFELDIPPNSLIYCDPPYEGVTCYKDKFDHKYFWNWCREKKKEGHVIFVSEYKAPEDFKCVWEGELKSSLSANSKSGGSKKSTEKLFTIA